MTDLALCWLVFPLVLLVLSLGCGRLLRSVIPGSRLPDPLLAPAGFALLVVVGGALTVADATAELATPVSVALALAGFVVGGPPRLGRPLAWPALAAAATFAVYAAPVVASGEATFAGYIELDDTATWLAFTDRVIEHGRSLDGLPPSTYEAVLAINLADGYPVGAFVPLGIASSLVGQDPAWTIQPYMAVLATLLALSLYAVARPLVPAPALRTAAAAVGAQTALLYGYYLWGGVKELAAAVLIAAAAACAARALRRRLAVPALVPLSLLVAALIGILSAGGAIWLAPALLAAAALAASAVGLETVLRRSAVFVALTALLSLPVLVVGGFLPPTSSPLTSSDALGNLTAPLDPLQLAGIWPAGDFRLGPDAELLSGSLVLVAIVAAAGALAVAWRRAEPGLSLYLGGTLLACAAIALLGSPWVEAKAFATASPAIPFAAALAGGLLWLGGRRAAGAALIAALAAGVLWSNALAYRDASLAPRDQLAELEAIGERIDGQGPTLLTEYQPYGARHFLREAAPESVSELRRRAIPLASGEPVPKGESADTDELSTAALLDYRTLVLRRSPARSRPPSPYRLVTVGDYYEVWQRGAGPAPELDRLPLGTASDPAGLARCDDVRRLAGVAEWLLAAAQPPPIVADRIEVRRPAPYEAWIQGSIRSRADLIVDGVQAGSIRHELNNQGQYVHLGTVELGKGDHELAVRFHGADLHPGSGGGTGELGPLTLTRAAPEPRIERVRPSDARSLCGRRLDWVEAAGG